MCFHICKTSSRSLHIHLCSLPTCRHHHPYMSCLSPSEFWEKRVKPESEEQGDCKSDIFDITPHVYLKYCKKVDFRKFLQAHGYMGSIHYALQKKDLPYYYFPSYDLEFPVGEAVILSASTHKHLKSVGLLPDVKYKDDVMMNRLFRMVSFHVCFSFRKAPLWFGFLVVSLSYV